MAGKSSLTEKIVDISLNILIVIFVVFLLISIYSSFQIKILKNDYTNFFGYSIFEVQTGSMSDTIEPGDWIILKLTKNVEINDIITYNQNGDYITHRVIETYKGTYVTKGDANSSKDDPIDQGQIVGKVVKILGGLGILRKTIFNPTVLGALIITLFLFHLTFKKKNKEETKFEKKVDMLLEKIKVFCMQIISKLKKAKEETREKEIVKPEIKIEKIKPKEEKPVKEKKEDIIPEPDKKTEEELSKTSIFRVVTVDKTDVKDKFAGEPQKTEEQLEEELSKTSMYRIISADMSDIDSKVQKIVEEEKEEDKGSQVYKVTLEAEKVVAQKKTQVEKKQELEVELEDLEVRINSKKSKNVIDKAINIKEAELNAILDILLKKEKSYIKNSNIRASFMNHYLSVKYYNLKDIKTTAKVKMAIKEFTEEMIAKNTRDEKIQDIAIVYGDAFLLISDLEQNRSAIADKENNYKALITRYDQTLKEEELSYFVYKIIEIQKKCNAILNEIQKKLDTNMFELKLSKIASKKDLFGLELNHNISFSKVYSDYIVDKTYNEGIVAEDKIAVLLTLLLGQLVKDMMSAEFDRKYILYIPSGLYQKKKKLDSLFKMIDDDYAKNHVSILIAIEEMLKNKKTIKELQKQGYHFCLALSKKETVGEVNKGYLYLAEYIFINKNEKEISNLLEQVPADILSKVIKEDIEAKIGDFGSE